MEKPSFKFNVGDTVIIGKTTWDNNKMKTMEGQIGVIDARTYYAGHGNGNHYRINRGYWFEEDCLTLEEEKPIEEITNDEVDNILQG